MAAIIRPIFHHSIAESIYEKIRTQSSVYYYFIGRVDPWSEDEAETLYVPDPVNTQQFESAARKNMVTLKNINIQDVALCARRVDWVSGTVYAPYDDTDVNLGTKDFYVITDEFNVYKCLSNNSDSESTVKPVGRGNTVNGIPFSPFQTGDGYIWKFMYSLPLILQNKFLVPSLMPVPSQAKNQYYSAGIITDYIIYDGSLNYGSGQDQNDVTVTITGDGTGAAAELQFDSNGAIDGVIITGESETVNITAASGDGEFVTYTTDTNTFYSDINNRTITIAGCSPSSFNVSVPTRIVSATSTSFTIRSTNEDTFLGDATPATAQVTASYPAGGIGYSSATLNVYIDGVLDTNYDIGLFVSDPGDLDSEQTDIESYAINGGISDIVVTNGSGSYTSAPTVTITGDGTGATAVSYIDVDGKVTSIEITDYGSGYTYANVSLSTEVITGGTAAATARVIISPYGGHGRNSPRELFADTLSFYSAFTNIYNHGVIPVDHDYRQFGIISNIRVYDPDGLDFSKYNTATGTAGFLLEGSFTGTDFEADSIISTSGGKNLQVITALDDKMLVISTDGSIPVVDDVFANDSAISFTITSLTEPNVDKYSGDILFIDNQVPFSATQEQEISFRTFIKL